MADLLNLKKIETYVVRGYLKQIKKIEIFEQINSTNAYLMQRAMSSQVKQSEIYICLAEQQTSGKE